MIEYKCSYNDGSVNKHLIAINKIERIEIFEDSFNLHMDSGKFANLKGDGKEFAVKYNLIKCDHPIMEPTNHRNRYSILVLPP